jgi:hypothetical protein
MPKRLEEKLKREYPNEPDAPYKIMNAKGLMHGNKVTAKGRAADRALDRARKGK